MTAETTSVVLPVHAGAAPDAFEAALTSIVAQDRPADEVVVVQDGPLPPALLAVVDRAREAHPRLLVVPLAENGGAGVANQAGLDAASGTWIVKADADDICRPERIRVQLDVLERTGADVCGAAMGEFDSDPQQLRSIRRNPASHAEIARRMRINNPINHPTAVFRRELAQAVGGYRPMRYMQDYDLFARLLTAGAQMVNTDDVLVLFRADDAMLARRRGRAMRGCEAELQRHLAEYGVISPVRRRLNYAARQTVRALPTPALHLAYTALFGRRDTVHLKETAPS